MVFHFQIVSDIINYMNKFLNKRLQQDNAFQPSSIRSLKSIMNQARVPLSQYINQRTSIENVRQQQGNHYFKKLKCMIQNNNVENAEQSHQQFMHQRLLLKRQYEKTDQLIYKESNTLNYERSRSKYQQKQPTSAKKRTNLSIKKNDRYKNLNGRVTQTSNKYRIKRQFNDKALRKDRVATAYQQNKPKDNVRTYKMSGNIQCISRSKQKQEISNNSIQKIESYRRAIYQKKQKVELINYEKFQPIFKCQFKSIHKVELSKVLGVGAHTCVKLGQDKIDNQKYAIKIYQKYKLIEPNQVKRVIRQANLLSKISHDNIISLVGAYQDKRQIHMLFQHIQNSVTLNEYFKIKNFNLSQKDSAFIIGQIVKGIQYLHSMGISHRDIKTQNVLIGIGQGAFKVKIIDFGFATTTNNTDVHCGTPNYMAPQLFSKGKTYNPQKVDIWALGVMIYYLIQGKYPFKGYNEKDLIRNMNKDKLQFTKSSNNCRILITSLINLNSEERPTCQQILNWLQSHQLFF